MTRILDPADLAGVLPPGAQRAHPDYEEVAALGIAHALVRTYAKIPAHRVIWYTLASSIEGHRGRCARLNNGTLVVALRVGLGAELARVCVHEIAHAATAALHAHDAEAWEQAAEDLTREAMKAWP